MNSDASWDEEYGSTKLDQIIQDELFDSSDSDEGVDMVMLMSMQEEMNRQVEHVLNFKGSIKERKSDQLGWGQHGYCTRTTLL